MDMEVSIYDEGTRDKSPEFTLRGHCPHCLRDAVFTQVTSVFIENGRPVVGASRWVAGLQCQGCLKHILGLVIHDPNHYYQGLTIAYETHYPLEKPNDDVAQEIPPEIKADFQEALRCRHVNGYNATVEMCRRAVESSCEEQGADPNLVLDKKIDWLFNQGKITKPLQDMAHKIRLGGNRGAHPPKRITEDEADAVIEFTNQYFHHIYVMPKRLDKFDFSRSAAKAAAVPPKKLGP